MATNSFPKDMDYRQEALQDKAASSKSDPEKWAAHLCLLVFFTATSLFHRADGRRTVYPLKLQPLLLLLFLFCSEPKLCCCFRFCPLQHLIIIILLFLVRFGPGFCIRVVVCAAPGPGAAASASAGAAGDAADEQRQHGRGQTQRGWGWERSLCLYSFL